MVCEFQEQRSYLFTNSAGKAEDGRGFLSGSALFGRTSREPALPTLVSLCFVLPKVSSMCMRFIQYIELAYKRF